MISKDVAIKVENISKVYRIGLKENMNENFGGVIFDFIKSPLKNYRKYRSLYSFDDVISDSVSNQNSDSSDIIWALKEVSFDVKQGEVLGIIGRNGAGKSTLLKILCRITDPTGGYAEIRGKVSSILEVGTGFHQELTGRENVYLNGTVLGMRKKEIDQRFDEIVEFSGVEKFIDTPVKRYSSGMMIRLAFSVVAHLEPEILIIDEVLAVGDAAFQRKCIGKMGAVAKAGRTVLFVSHNMGAVTELCDRVMWLDEGREKMDGAPNDVVSSYLSVGIQGKPTWSRSSGIEQNAEVAILSACLLSQDDKPTSVSAFDTQFKIELVYDVLEQVRDLSVSFQIVNSRGIIAFEAMDTDLPEWKGKTRETGKYLAECKIPAKFLKPDNYTVTVVAFIERVKIIERQERILSFEISEVGYCLNPGRLGVVSPLLEWEVTRIDGQRATYG